MSSYSGGLIEEALTESVIGAFYEVYNALGPGFLEHVYSLALERELMDRGHIVAREYTVLIFYKDAELTSQRLDMVVDGKLVVELKATTKLPASASRQVLSYLRATNLEVGLLLHFGPKSGFFRLVAANARKAHQPRSARDVCTTEDRG